MPWIRFTRAYKVQPDGPAYAEGDVVEVNDRSLFHFVDRGAAEETSAPAPKPKPKPTEGSTDAVREEEAKIGRAAAQVKPGVARSKYPVSAGAGPRASHRAVDARGDAGASAHR